jgi:hypothetical protein
LITITRRFASKLRSVFRRAFGTRGIGPVVCFTTEAGGLRVKARRGDIAIEYHDGDHAGNASERIWLPLQLLADCAGKTDEPVELESLGGNHVLAHWLDRNVPQNISYDADPPADVDQFPIPAEHSVENPPQLLQALHDASETTDPDSVRYAFGCIQLRATGTLAASDGRQVLIQSGFQFPQDVDLLIPASKIFESTELPHDEPVRLGKSGDWVALGLGPWTIYLAVNKEGRFPDVDRHLPRPDTAKANCRFSAGDAAFLGETLPRLPANAEFNFPITFELNGSIAVRAKAADQSQATEVVLNSSEWSGAPIRITTNRKYLKRAIKLGFREILLFGNEVPVYCQDERRRYGWAILESKSAIGPAADAIRIESPKSGTEVPAVRPISPRRTLIVSEPTDHQNYPTAPPSAKQNGQAKTNGETKVNGQAYHAVVRPAGPQHLGGLIEQTEIVRESLREALVKTNDLLKGLKRQRQLSRSVESTLASLRQLKTLGV